MSPWSTETTDSPVIQGSSYTWGSGAKRSAFQGPLDTYHPGDSHFASLSLQGFQETANVERGAEEVIEGAINTG